jgi:hypothetical protein
LNCYCCNLHSNFNCSSLEHDKTLHCPGSGVAKWHHIRLSNRRSLFRIPPELSF